MSKVVEEIQSQLKRVKVYSSVNVTPKVAAELLEMNVDNRPIKARLITHYSEQMKKGAWKFNGDIIRISKTGRLLDGQHRLRAIILSETAQVFNIQTGMDDEIFSVIDIGKNRSAGDAVATLGYKNASIMAGAIKLIIAYEKGQMAAGGSGVLQRHSRSTNTDVVNWIGDKKMDHMISCVEAGSRFYQKARFFSPATYAGFMYLFSNKSITGAEDFLTKFTTGEDISSKKHSGIYHLRQKLINASASRGTIMDTNHKYALLIKAWNMYREGREVARLYWSQEEGFPKVK